MAFGIPGFRRRSIIKRLRAREERYSLLAIMVKLDENVLV
jgi:hypothetical protein